jgi:hypothetical protein
VGRQAVPFGGPWNIADRHEAWEGLDVDLILADLGYRPEPRRSRRPAFFGAPPRRTGLRSPSPPDDVKQEEEAPIMPPDLDPKEAFHLALEASMVEEDQKWDDLQEALQTSAMAARAPQQEMIPPPPPLPLRAEWAGQLVPPSPMQDAW